MSECLFKDSSGVFEAADHQAPMYQVKLLRVCPFVFGIFDFELAIGWHTGYDECETKDAEVIQY